MIEIERKYNAHVATILSRTRDQEKAAAIGGLLPSPFLKHISCDVLVFV